MISRAHACGLRRSHLAVSVGVRAVKGEVLDHALCGSASHNIQTDVQVRFVRDAVAVHIALVHARQDRQPVDVFVRVDGRIGLRVEIQGASILARQVRDEFALVEHPNAISLDSFDDIGLLDLQCVGDVSRLDLVQPLNGGFDLQGGVIDQKGRKDPASRVNGRNFPFPFPVAFSA